MTVDYTKPIEYLNGNPATFIETFKKDDGTVLNVVTPEGAPGAVTGNYYDTNGNHYYNLFKPVRNKVLTPAEQTDLDLARAYRKADAEAVELARELNRRGYIVTDEYGEAQYFYAVGRIYKTETVAETVYVEKEMDI